MHRTSGQYQALLADPLHRKEVRVSAADTVYGQGQIVSMTTSGGFFTNNTMEIGGAAAREIDLTLFLDHSASVPKMAELRPACRLIRGAETSEWLSKGVFYIDSRDEEQAAGGRLLVFHGFDAMLKAEQEWVPDQSLEFPMTMAAAAAELARLMGTELDPRCRLRTDYFVDYPANGYTQRDVLRFIAAAHAGNWIITDEGRLLLVPLVSGTGDTVNMGQSMGSLEFGLAFEPISGVVVMVDDETYYEAGNDSEKVLEITCPYGSQVMAQNLLEELRGYTYQPMQAADALLEPAAELGDLVSGGGVTTVLAQADVTFDGLMAADIAAPGQREMSGEYPYQTGAIRELNRKLASTRSEITKTSEQIKLTVETVNAEAKKLAELKITVGSITSRVEDAEIGVSEIEQYAKSIRLSVTNGETSSTFKLTAGTATLSSGDIQFTGFVTFAGLSGGTTTIDGACIKTGKITADRIDVDSLKVSKIYDSSGKKTAIDCSDPNTLYIGGKSVSNAYNELIIKGTTIAFNRWGDTDAGISINNTSPYYMRPATSNLYKLGDSTHPWAGCYTTEVTIIPASSPDSGMTLGSLGIIPAKDEGLNLGSSIHKWNFLYVYGIMLDGLRIYGNRVNYDANIYATMNSSKQFAPQASTGYSLGSSSYPWQYAYITKLYLNGAEFKPSDYAKAGNIYRLYAGGNSTTYLLTYNSSRQLVPSHTGSSYGSSIGNSSYPFYYGYFTNLTIKEGTINLGTSGAKLGFFGTSAATRKYVATCSTSSSVAASTVASALNTLINALKGYGLIS